MNNIELLNKLNKSAQKYRVNAQSTLERNNHMSDIEPGEKVQQRIIDAVLVDFINSIAMDSCIDYALYTDDLKTTA